MYQIKTNFRGQVYYWYGNMVKWKLSQDKAVAYDSIKRAELELERIQDQNDWSSKHVEIIKVKVL